MLTTLLAVALSADPSPCVGLVTPTGTASGTVVSRRGGSAVVLTCRHVCVSERTGADRPPAVMVDGRLRVCRVLALSGTADLALVLAEVDNPPCRVAAGEPSEGEAVWHRGTAAKFQLGRYVGPGKVGVELRPTSRLDLLTLHGDSGAAVMNRRGELVGVLWGRMLTPGLEEVFGSGVAGGVPLGAVRGFLAANLPAG